MSRSIEFWSSVELGAFARGLVRHLTSAGWNAQQRFEVPEDEYRGARTPWARRQVRLRSYLSYVGTLRRRLRSGNPPSVVVVCTNTFYAPAFALRAARGLGIPVVHWVFDLYPDVLVASGSVAAGSYGQRCLSRLTRWTFERAAANVFLGDRLLEHARSRYGEIPSSAVIPVGADGDLFRTPPVARAGGAPVRVLYCGNLGRMHDTKTVLDLLRLGPPAGWRMEFRGHGAGFRALALATASSPAGHGVVLGDSLGEGDWTRAMNDADLALVTMIPGAESLVMPSKTYSAMMAGQAILAICPRHSDLAETVRRHDAGWVVEPGDVEGLRAVLADAVARPGEVLAKRRHSFRAGHDHYDQAPLAARWDELLTAVCSHPRPTPGHRLTKNGGPGSLNAGPGWSSFSGSSS